MYFYNHKWGLDFDALKITTNAFKKTQNVL